MANYTTFFLCRREDLSGGFRDWRRPLVKPIRRQVRDPFSGKVSAIDSYEPEWPDEVAEEDRVVETEGSYEDYLERRLPAFVQSCPHWSVKGLTEVELDPLLKIAGITEAMEYAMYSPPSYGATIQQLPAEFLAVVQSLDELLVGQAWAVVMSAPEYTHSESGKKLSD